MFRPK
jgi:hypothetical protein